MDTSLYRLDDIELIVIAGRLVPRFVSVIATALSLVVPALAAEITVDEIISRLQDIETSVLSQPSILIEFVHDREYPGDAAVIDSHKAVFTSIARKGEMLLAKWYEIEGERSLEQWTSWKDRVGVGRVHMAVTIYPEPESQIWERNHYFNNQFIDFYKGIKGMSSPLKRMSGHDSFSAAGSKTLLPVSIVNSNDEWIVEPTTKEVDGHDCIVISRKKLDRIWLDPKCGYACRRRERRNEKGLLLAIRQARNLRQYAKGIWLPMEQITTGYIHEGTSARVRVIETNLVKRLSFSTLPDAYFDVPIPEENGVVTDVIRNVSYQLHPYAMTEKESLNRALYQARSSRRDAQWEPGVLEWSVLVLVNFLLLAWYYKQTRT